MNDAPPGHQRSCVLRQSMCLSSWLIDNVSSCVTTLIAEHQHVHPRAEKAVERFRRPVHDRLVLVERGVQHDRHAGAPLERADELPVAADCRRG